MKQPRKTVSETVPNAPREGWGAKVIDRISANLREAYPEMSGLSPRNLKYMRSFAAAWPDRSLVQEALAQVPWYHHIALLERCGRPDERLWYAGQSAAHGWSHNILKLQQEVMALAAMIHEDFEELRG